MGNTTIKGTLPLASVGLPLVLAALSIGGCGKSRGDEQDAALLNSKLVIIEADLYDRVAALTPKAVDNARQTVSNMLLEANAAILSLPQIDTARINSLVGTLAKFRKDISQPENAISNAVMAATNARREASLATDSLCSVNSNLATRQWSDFISSFAEKTSEAGHLLAGWRKERLSKMENGEFMTFPTFYVAARERYDECGRWIDEATSKQRSILGEFLPKAQSAMSNALARAGDVRQEHAHIDAALSKIRAIPVDTELVATARKRALGMFDGDAMDAVWALGKWTEGERKFPSAALERINKVSTRSCDLEANAAKFAIDHADYMPEHCRQEAETSAANARAVCDKMLAELMVLESGMADLQNELKMVANAVLSARKAADGIRAMTPPDEELLVSRMSEIEDMVKTLRQFNALARRKAVDEKRLALEADLQETEQMLASAWDKLNAAKDKALADEKTVKLEEAKQQARGTLSSILEKLETDPPPGYTRPEDKVSSVKRTIDTILVAMNHSPSMTETSLRSAVGKVQNDISNIESQTKWTVGARHPAKPHIHAIIENGNGVWSPDPGYSFNDYGADSDLSVHWEPGQRHPDHPRVSAGKKEGTWDPAPGYKARWNGDVEPVWAPGARHPAFPHIHASERERIWTNDPGYAFIAPDTKDLSVRWEPGSSHPSFEGIRAAQKEGYWYAIAGWEFVHPGTSDLQARWVPGAHYPNLPHVHAGDKKDLWIPDDGYSWVNPEKAGDYSVKWTPGALSDDGRRRAGQYEGQFETKHQCTYCHSGYTSGWQKCSLCKGSGEAIYRTECPRCFGKGREKATLRCSQCDGTGFRWY